MDYMLSSDVNVYKEQQFQSHAQAWHSATQAKILAGKKLIAALYHTQDYSTRSSSSPADLYAHNASPEADPFGSLVPPSENNMPLPSRHENYGARLDRGECAHPDDVLLLVGKSRQKFYLNAETLISGSAYFKHLLQRSHSPPPLPGGQAPISHSCNGGFTCPPFIIDCEEHIFEGLLLLMRYGTLEALPSMSTAETFLLKKEAEFYGIHYKEPPPKSRVPAAESGDDGRDMSSVRSRSSSPSGSPKSMTSDTSSRPELADKGVCRHAQSGRFHEGVPLLCSMQRQLAELPEFPPDLADPARLVLVSCLGEEKALIYTCRCSSRQWALNFHHRHAFCTSCSHPPNVSPKHFTEMFMAAAAHYSSGQTAALESYSSWWVSSDSTCMLCFISSAGDGPDACSCSDGNAGAGKEAPPTIWAANCFYSYAFCTCCGQAARGPVLLSLILALRYGGRNKASKCTGARSSFRIPAEKVL